MPQIPGHGSTHFRFLHARFTEQSELTVHSARQFGGLPINVDKQEHTAWSFNSRHWLLSPQGLGLHGLYSRAKIKCKSSVKRQIILNCIKTFKKKNKKKHVTYSYFALFWYKRRMRCRCIRVDTNTTAHDSPLDKLRYIRRNLNRDFDTSIRYTLDSRYNRSLSCIRVDSLRTDCLCNPADTCKSRRHFARDIQRWSRKATEHRVWV